jgi:ESCRT-II complex subunit VPS22
MFIGVSGIQKRQIADKLYESLGDKIVKDKVETLKKQHALLKSKLEHFAKSRQSELSGNPVLLEQFRQICALCNVDTLQSTKTFIKSSRFYEEVAVQIIEACIEYRESTGGLLQLNFLVESVKKARCNDEIGINDIKRAIDCLAPLGSPHKLIHINGIQYLQSIPVSLVEDDLRLIGAFAEVVSEKEEIAKLHWTGDRFQSVMLSLIKKGIVWIDEMDERGTSYWFACNYFRNIQI